MFKVGDKVRIIIQDYEEIPIGTIGKVTNYNGSSYMVSNNDYMDFHFLDLNSGDFHLCFLESELELAD